MGRYMTEQRRELIAFLREHPDCQFTARQIAGELSGTNISLSAVYRNLAALESRELISRSVRDGSREIYYQYTDTAECRECIHLTCTDCGRTIHMDASAARTMLDTVYEKNDFYVSKSKTVLYGLCRGCGKQGEKH